MDVFDTLRQDLLADRSQLFQRLLPHFSEPIVKVRRFRKESSTLSGFKVCKRA